MTANFEAFAESKCGFGAIAHLASIQASDVIAYLDKVVAERNVLVVL